MRPGTVYHVYCRSLYDNMHDYEVSEVHRQPMTEITLHLKAMLSSVSREEEEGGGGEGEGEGGDGRKKRGNVKSQGGSRSVGAVLAAEDDDDEDVEDEEEEEDDEEDMTSAAVAASVVRAVIDSAVDTSGTDNSNIVIAAPTTGNNTSAPITSGAPAVTKASSDTPTTSTAPTPTPTPALLPGVTAVLLALIEPPSLESIEDALYQLYEFGMLSAPYDGAHLTEIGALAAALPVDFMLGRFVGYAVLLGVPREAAIIAAALGNPKSPFRTPNQMIQTDPDEFNRLDVLIYLFIIFIVCSC